MRQRIAITLLGLIVSSHAAALAPSLHLSTDKQRLAHEAARILQQEADKAKENAYPLVVMVPTGSTAVPFYEQIVRLHKDQSLDLSHITLFNMDEYVGHSTDDMPASYNAFMNEHLYHHVQDKPLGLPAKQIHIPRFVTSTAEAAQAATEYREALASALSQPRARFVVFGGIGVSPAHIAFNDLTTEDFYDDDSLTETQKSERAMALPTRLVKLDAQTSQTNGVKFTHAITVGLSELMRADRIVIMANTESKQTPVEQTFQSSPCYRVPASLLTNAKAQVEYMITPEVLTPILAKNAKGIEPAAHRASLVNREVPGTQTVTPDANKRVLMVRFDSTQAWPSYWDQHYPHAVKLSTSDATIIHNAVQTIQPALLVFPIAHDKNTQSIIDSVENVAARHASTWGKTLIAQYDTDAGLLSRYNYWIALDDEQQTRFENARNQHVSQVRRTAFADIPKLKSQGLLSIAAKTRPQSSVGLEGYFVSDLKGNPIDSFSPAQFSASDRLVVIAPHPDDAEIGAAGLIDQFANTPTDVWTITQGHHAAISVEDVLDNPNMPEELVRQAQALHNGLIDDPSLKSAIRHQESSLAVSLLAQKHKHAHHVKPLALPFYDNKYEISSKDESILLSELEQLKAVKNIVLAVPFADDEHVAHRVARQIALEQFTRWQEAHPEQSITVVAYATPWTGKYRLYDYNNEGSTADAIIGAERLQGKGLAGNVLWEQLNRASAQRYQLYQVG